MREPPYIRIAVFSFEEVFPFVTVERTFREYAGYQVAMDSQRYQVFLKGTECVACGLKATHFALERQPNDKNTPPGRAHLNLYGIRGGKEVLFTKDHITPRHHGGRDSISNYRTMCTTCNMSRGHAMQAELRSKHPHSTCWLNLELPAGTARTSKPYAALLKDLQSQGWGTEGHVGLAVQVIDSVGSLPDEVSINPPHGSGLFGGWTPAERDKHLSTVKAILKRHNVPTKMRRMTTEELM